MTQTPFLNNLALKSCATLNFCTILALLFKNSTFVSVSGNLMLPQVLKQRKAPIEGFYKVEMLLQVLIFFKRKENFRLPLSKEPERVLSEIWLAQNGIKNNFYPKFH